MRLEDKGREVKGGGEKRRNKGQGEFLEGRLEGEGRRKEDKGGYVKGNLRREKEKDKGGFEKKG